MKQVCTIAQKGGHSASIAILVIVAKRDKEKERSERTAKTAIIAFVVRNRMEEFHCEHLTDRQMKQLNPIIRQGIYEALCVLDTTNPQRRRDILQEIAISIPQYWESPAESDYTRRLERDHYDQAAEFAQWQQQRENDG